MFASALIIGFSVILLVYWFRYSCVLLLRNSAEQNADTQFPADQRYSFPGIRERLRTEAQLDPLQRALGRDYQVLTYLVQHTAGLELEGIERRILTLDYRCMQWWYRITKTAAPDQARKALSEMADILTVLNRRIGEQTAFRQV
jgi:hypothetical protein